MSMPSILAAALGLAASVTDLRNRTVPNWLTCPAILCGLLWYGITGGLRGAGFSLAGAMVGFGSLLVFFLMGNMGGGDVKLLAAFGALVGPGLVFQALIWIALLGGVGAAATVFWRAWHSRAKQSGVAQGEYVPYAPAIVGGVWLTLWAS
ncbi:MAG: prepilin peptidase [Bryobacterales bacterium]|nr:prepilin peptidase [Bryobacterales bacterium]